LPADVVATIEQAMTAIGTAPDVQKWFEAQGLQYSGIGGAPFVEFSRGEQNLYADIVKKGNIARH
jgi:hypothetical protein